MEFGYKNLMDFISQFRHEDGTITHALIKAGSEKDAKRQLSNEAANRGYPPEAKLVTNIKADGSFGAMGDGQLPNADQNLEQVIQELKEE